MKIFKKIALLLLAGMTLSACVEEPIVMFDPTQSVAPVISTIEGVTLAEDGEAIQTTFNSAKFDVTSPIGHSLYLAPSGSTEASTIPTTISNGTVSFSQKDLNSFILNSGGADGEEFAVDFWMEGYLCNDKTVAIPGSEIKSNVVTAIFIPYEATLLDRDIYTTIWVIGASETLGAWDHSKVNQFLYNYNKDSKTFTGLIFYGDKAADGWKLTGAASWDDATGNWGSEAQAEEAEARTVSIIAGSGSKDIKCYSKKYYMWSFDKNSLILTKMYGFDNIGLVGSINGWNQADATLKMNYNTDYHRFWIDYTFEDASQEIKFTCDDAWDLNFGQDCKSGGDNIKAPAGSYRIYLDLNHGKVTFDSKMFGQEEPSLAIPEPAFVGWSIIGTINGTSWDTDFDMTDEGNGIWSYKNLVVTDTDEFKIRQDHAWSVSVGGPEANDKSTIDASNPYDVYKPEIGTKFTAGGNNIAIHAAGAYDVVYDTNTNEITVSQHLAGWTLIGMVEESGWDADFEMKEGPSGVWVSSPVVIKGEFKLRFNNNWDINRGGKLEALDKPFAVTDGGENIVVPDAGDKYIVTYYQASEAVIVQNLSKSWSIIGNINGTAWDYDVIMTQTSENVWSATCKVDSECKIRFGADWAVNRGGEIAAIDTPFTVTDGGANIKLEPGFYTITYNAATEQITINLAWGLIGLNGDWNNDSHWMIKDGDGNYVCNAALLNSEWKIRQNAGWDVNRGGTFAALDTPFQVEHNGSNIAPVEGLLKVVYKPADETITISKAL